MLAANKLRFQSAYPTPHLLSSVFLPNLAKIGNNTIAKIGKKWSHIPTLKKDFAGTLRVKQLGNRVIKNDRFHPALYPGQESPYRKGLKGNVI